MSSGAGQSGSPTLMSTLNWMMAVDSMPRIVTLAPPYNSSSRMVWAVVAVTSNSRPSSTGIAMISLTSPRNSSRSLLTSMPGEVDVTGGTASVEHGQERTALEDESPRVR